MHTCEWLWVDENYHDWLTRGSSSLLCIQGKPGSGKSTLAKRILCKIRDSVSTSDDLVAYFFYSFRGGRWETSHVTMLQSIFYQLLEQEPRLFNIVRDSYRAQRRAHSPHFTWEMPVLVDMLKALANFEMNGKVYLVLDAMDESDDRELPQILGTIQEVCSPNSRCTIKAVMTTRPLHKKIAGQQVKELSSLSLIMDEKNRADIETMVDREIKNITDDVRQEDDTIETTVFDGIRAYIKNHADGVFLWVSIVLKEFKRLTNEGWSKTNLDHLKVVLPVELKDLYQRITQRLEKNLSEPEIALGRKLLTFASFALRRLSIEEIGDMVIVPSLLEDTRFQPHRGHLDRRINLLGRRIQIVCGDLLEVKQRSVQLMHESVREFLLEENQIAAPFDAVDQRGKDELALLCTRYLRLSLSCQVLEEAGVCRASVAGWKQQDYEAFLRLLEDRPLLEYVIFSFRNHLEQAKRQEILQEFHSFVEEAMTSAAARYFLLESVVSPIPNMENERTAARQFRIKAMVAAARGGYPKAIKSLITAGTSVDSVDEKMGIAPLHAAVGEGHDDMVQHLLNLHASPDIKDSLDQTALHKAAANGQTQMAQVLLGMGAYVDAENLINERPLHLAAAHGHQGMVVLLLSYQAYVNGRDRYGGTPLHRAVANGHIKIANILLTYGAFVDAGAEYGGSPLHLAVDKKNVAMTKLLLEAKANVDFDGSYGGTALHSASAAGDDELVSLLLQYGANVEVKDRYGHTALDWASAHGHHSVLKLLISKCQAIISCMNNDS